MRVFQRLRNDTNQDGNNGFTVAELMVTMMIVGTVASTAMPSLANGKKDAIDQKTMSNLLHVGQELKTYETRGSLAQKAGLEEVKNSFTKSASKGTVLTLERTLSGYCVSAYNKDGFNDASNPLLFDSEQAHGLGGITPETTANCPSKSLSGTAYIVNAENQLEALETPVQASRTLCKGVSSGAYSDTDKSLHVATIEPVGTGSKSVELVGNFELNETCDAVKYSLRVKNTVVDPALLSQTTTFRLHTVTERQGSVGPVASEFSTITLTGNQTGTGELPTEWNAETLPESLAIHGISESSYEISPSISNWNTGGDSR